MNGRAKPEPRVRSREEGSDHRAAPRHDIELGKLLDRDGKRSVRKDADVVGDVDLRQRAVEEWERERKRDQRIRVIAASAIESELRSGGVVVLQLVVRDFERRIAATRKA